MVTTLTTRSNNIAVHPSFDHGTNRDPGPSNTHRGLRLLLAEIRLEARNSRLQLLSRRLGDAAQRVPQKPQWSNTCLLSAGQQSNGRSRCMANQGFYPRVDFSTQGFYRFLPKVSTQGFYQGFYPRFLKGVSFFCPLSSPFGTKSPKVQEISKVALLEPDRSAVGIGKLKDSYFSCSLRIRMQ